MKNSIIKNNNIFLKRSLRVAFFSGLSGLLFGIVETLNIESSKKFRKKYGYTTFPAECPSKMSDILSSNFIHTMPNCENLPAKLCESSIECQQSCGPHFMCVEIFKETIYNNHSLEVGQKFCLPKFAQQIGCQSGMGYINISFDQIAREFKYICSCRYPDIFAGTFCDKFIACLDPSNPNIRAPLIDRTTGKEVDLNDHGFIGNVNFYETLENGVSRFYCRCKDISKLLTSSIHPLQCLKDPCFELFSVGDELHPAATGWTEGHVDSTTLNCHCGPSHETRLFGGGANPCLPIMDENCGVVSFDKSYQGFRCACNADQVFMPCRNRYRPEAVNLPECGTDGNYMLRHDAPEAGSCVNVCKFCNKIKSALPKSHGRNFKDICQDDIRTMGHCQIDKSLPAKPLLPGSTQDMYRCSCDVEPWAEFWRVDAAKTTGPCKGSKPSCKWLFGSCDTNIELGWQGYQCCHCPLTCLGQLNEEVGYCVIDLRRCI